MLSSGSSFESILGWSCLTLGLVALVAFGVSTELAPPPPAEAKTPAVAGGPGAADLHRAWQLLGGGVGITAEQLAQDPRRLERALGILEGILDADPNSAAGHHLLGVHGLASGDLDRARGALERSLELEPRRLEALLALGAVHYEAEDLEAAEEVFRRAVELHPRAITAWHNLGQTVWLLGRQDEALEIYRRKIEIHQSLAEADPAAAGAPPP